MAAFQIFKETAMPGTPAANAIYIIKSGSTYRMIVTDNAGAIVQEDSVTAAQLASGLAGKEDSLPGGGTTAKYLRGDKTWQTLDKSAVGLGNVDNTSDANKPVSTATATALALKEDKANKGVANGYASLDGTGKVPSSQLPSYVDDVLEFANLAAFPATGEPNKIYIAIDTNLAYRWTGSAYQKIADGAVTSVFGRTGVVAAQAGDYAGFYVRHDTATQALTGTQQGNARANIDAASISQAQTFGGANTFSKVVVAPTAPTLGTHLTNKDYVDQQVSTAVASAMTWASTNW